MRLAGELTVPAGDGAFPALVLVPGTGANQRDCEYPGTGHKHFLVLSHLMTMQGYAVLRYDGPVLSLYGDKDLLVSSKMNAPSMRKALQHPKSEVHILSGYNHFFQRTENGGPDEYWKIKTTFDENIVDMIDAWFKGVI